MRSCGDCTACCSSMAVVELNKFAGVKCEHVCSTGCAIYLNRPDECAQFKCLWLDDDDELMTREEDRPEKSGIVLTFIGQSVDPLRFKQKYGYPPLQAFETWPGALKTWRAQKLLNRVRRRAIIVTCEFGGTGREIIAPDDVPTAVRERLKAMATRNAEREAAARLDASSAVDFFASLRR